MPSTDFILSGECWERTMIDTLRSNPKSGVQVILHRGAKVRPDAAGFSFDDPTGLLTWPGPDRAILAVADDESARAVAPQLAKLVALWIVA